MTHLRVLDAQRGLCALLVALYHAKGVSHISGLWLVQGSWLFVDFFFVLSGFVIAFVYLDRIDNGASFVNFVIRRFGRLWPLHVFVLSLYIISEALKAAVVWRAGLPVHAVIFTDTMSPSLLLPNLLMVHSLGLYPTLSWNVPSWSISVEFYTYLVFAGVCVVMRRLMLATSLILIGGSVLVLSVWTDSYLGATPAIFGVFRCWYGFFLGVLTLFCYRAVSGRGFRLPAPSLLETVSIGLAIWLVMSGRDGGPITLLAPVVFAAVVFCFAFEGGVLSRLLRQRAFLWLGDRSYALYMVHMFVADALVRVLLFAAAMLPVSLVAVGGTRPDGQIDVSFGDRLQTDLFVIIYVAAALVCADLLHRAVEWPSRAFFNRVAERFLLRRAVVEAREAG